MRSLRRLKLLANLDAMIFSGTQIMFFALVPFIAEKSQQSLSTVIASFSLGSFLFLFASPYWAAKSDSWGRIPVLAMGMFGLTLSTGLLILTVTDFTSTIPAEILLWSSRIIYGLTASSIVPVSQSLQIDVSNKTGPMRALISNSMSLNIGRALGPLYILLGSAASLVSILYGAFLATCALAFYNLSEVRSLDSEKKNKPPISLNWFSTFKQMRSLFSLAILFTTFIGVLNFSLATILQKTFSLDSTQAGLLMAQVLLISAVLAVLMQILGRVFFKNPWQGTLLIGSVSLFTGAAILGVMNSYVSLWIAVIFLSGGISLLPPSYLSLIVSNHREELGLGKRAGLMGAANTLGYTLGGALAAWCFKWTVVKSENLLFILGLLIFVNIAFLYRTRPLEVRHA